MESKKETIEQNLRLLRQIAPNPHWQDTLRSSLLEKGVRAKQINRFLSLRWQIVATLVLLILFLAGGTAAAAQGSVPGDLLYPVKRGLENFRLVFADSEEKFIIQQELAAKRIAELKKIALKRRYEAATPAVQEVGVSIAKVSERVSMMTAKYQTLKQLGEDITPIKEALKQLVPVIEQKQAELEQIEDSLPEPTRAQVGEIKITLENLETRVQDALEMVEEPKQPIESGANPDQGASQTPTNRNQQNTR